MYRCLSSQYISYKPLQPLIDKFSNTYSLCDNDNERFVLLLRKGVYPYEYIDNWERFNETALPSKDAFYSNLNLEYINDKHYNHCKNCTEYF